MRTVAILGTFLLLPAASGQVHHAHDLTLDQLFTASATLSQETASEAVWAGYSIHRQMYADSRFGWYSAGSDRPALAEILGDGTTPHGQEVAAAARRALAGLEDEQPLVTKEVGILFQLMPSQQTISQIRLVTMDAPARLGGAPILWAGSRPDSESLDFLESLWTDLTDELREDVVTAIGAHDLPDRVMPLLVEVTRSYGDRDAGETARHWLADHLSVAMGLRPESRGRRTSDDEVRRSALYALVNVEEGRAGEMLVRLVTSSPDSRIRRLALIQLAHLDGRAGESALLRMAERYVRTGG